MPTFRAKARAVDLLGKGQIADLPTAISELWKNGYDAYAGSLECHLYLKGFKGIESPFFTLGDDGSGMNTDDIEEKWVVLGTDSRKRGENPPLFNKEERIPMGEKGIGRLSVAYLGNLMLMLTKKQDERCVALFMDWEILDNFNLFLDDLDIPLKELHDVTEIGTVFKELREQFGKNLEKGNWDEHIDLKEKIGNDFNNILLPDFIDEEVLEHLKLPGSHGTYFLIFDPHEQLLSLSQEELIEISEDSVTKYLRSSLSGMYDGFKENKDIGTRFWLHDSRGKYDLISRDNFFTDDEIYQADHWVVGEFDENGFFTGELQVFNEIIKHTFRPVRPPGPTPYGPFEIKFGFMEGAPKSSKLPEEQFRAITKKLDVFGGLYIYRDKFRVLPYGRTENDFLSFEARRSKSATYYQFSHRRMYGFISITRDKNTKLVDKAGREGFISNKAYREFVDDLIKFFIDLSRSYFRTVSDGEKPTLREQQIDAIQKHNERILKQEKKLEKQTKSRFRQELKENSERLDDLLPRLEQLHETLRAETQGETIIYNNVESIFRDVGEKKSELSQLRITKPRRFTITPGQENKLSYYNQRLTESLSILVKCDDIIKEATRKLPSEYLLAEFKKKSEQLRRDITRSISTYKKRYMESTQKLDDDISDDQKEFDSLFLEKTAQLIPSGHEEKEELENRLIRLEKIHGAIKEEIEEKYDGFIKRVESLSFDIDDDLLMGWYKDRYQKIEERVEAMQELAQLGVAIEIIDHQFNVLYSEMASAIDFFGKFTDTRKDVKENFRQLKESFQHLENNHQLLVPLYRTTRRVKSELWGKDIIKYMKSFFRDNLRKYRIELTSDKSFDNHVFYTYESVITAVFINVVNNALYWLIPVKDRKIHMSYDDGKILVMNSGEPIDPAYGEEIFKLFFTRKPGGRGIGLYLARLNLRSVGYDIYCEFDKKYNRLKGACFVIEPYDEREEENRE